MKQLGDDYLSEMLSNSGELDSPRLKSDVKKCLKIKDLFPSIEVFIPKKIDLHGKSLDAAMAEIDAAFYTFENLAARGILTRENNCFVVVTGKAGEKKDAFATGIAPGGIWSHQIKSSEQINPGSYKITVRIKP